MIADAPILRACIATLIGLGKAIPRDLTVAEMEEGDKTSLANCDWMIDQCLKNATTMPLDKLNRWIGFVQGVLAVRGYLDVDAERERTRPLFHAAYRENWMRPPESQERP